MQNQPPQNRLHPDNPLRVISADADKAATIYRYAEHTIRAALEDIPLAMGELTDLLIDNAPASLDPFEWHEMRAAACLVVIDNADLAQRIEP